MKFLAHIFLLMCFILGFSACENSCRVGIGDYVTRELAIDSIASIEVGLPARVLLHKDTFQRVEIRAQQNVIEDINQEVLEGFWAIDHLGPCLEVQRPVELRLSLTELRALILNGIADISLTNPFDSLENLEVANNSTGAITLQGNSKRIEITLNTSGMVDGASFSVSKAMIQMAGSGSVDIRVSDTLKVEMIGEGDVYYRGDPFVEITGNGTGRVVKI